MIFSWTFRFEPGRWIKPLAFVATAAACVAMVSPSDAQEMPRPHRVLRVSRPHSAARVLTVHRRASSFADARPGVERDYSYEDGLSVPRPFRRWNDPDLDGFGGWRIGGDDFYGDGRGDPITRGNAALGAIAGYGPARGGYGGPHFDSVGGFHNGPGPDAQEDADYASGSISRPDYGGIVPHYPSLKARVASLNSGVVPSVTSARFVAASRATAPGRTAHETGPRYLRDDELFPDLDPDAF